MKLGDYIWHVIGIVIVFVLLLLVSGCTESPVASRDIGFVAPDIVTPCPPLAELPETNLSMAQVEIYWRADRMRYVECRSSKDELLQTLVDRRISWNIE